MTSSNSDSDFGNNSGRNNNNSNNSNGNNRSSGSTPLQGPPGTSAPPGATPAAPPRLMVVEDEAIIALELSQQLTELGYEVCGIADTTEEALVLAARHRPDLVLMDVVIKGQRDGIDTAQALNTHLAVPVIYLTAFSDPSTVQRAAQTGPYGYLTKPYQPQELRAAIEVGLAKHRLEQQQRANAERFRIAFEQAPLGMALVNPGGQFLQGNAALHRLLGTDDRLLPTLGLADVSAADESPPETLRLQTLACGPGQPALQYEKRFRAQDGRVFWGAVSVSLPAHATDGACCLYQVVDITTRKDNETRLNRLASQDALTGLPNRLRMADELARRCRGLTGDDSVHAVLLVDLDDFKRVNDRQGHAAGDAVLREVSRRMRATLRSNDLVARWGGDEFVVLLNDVRGPEPAQAVARKLLAALLPPIALPQEDARIGASIGIALYPQHGDDPNALLALADAALYQAKALGKYQVCLYGAGTTAPPTPTPDPHKEHPSHA